MSLLIFPSRGWEPLPPLCPLLAHRAAPAALLEVRDESLAAATWEKHDAIIRRNLGMNETGEGSGTLSVSVLAGRVSRTRIAIETENPPDNVNTASTPEATLGKASD
jgi:hypothetical protein